MWDLYLKHIKTIYKKCSYILMSDLYFNRLSSAYLSYKKRSIRDNAFFR